MKIQRYIIILVAMLSALAGFSRSATDNKTFDRFYNMTPNDFKDQLNYYIHHNMTDSAMLCADIQANKYGKEKLTYEEINACCAAFRYIGLEYLRSYCNYQLANENYLKSEQIADEYGFAKNQIEIIADKAMLAAMQNDLENNFVYNKNVMDGFKKSVDYTLNKSTSIDRSYINIVLETSVPNLMYLALKFDKTQEIINEITKYRNAQKMNDADYNIAKVFCDAIDYYNSGNYSKALEALHTPISQTTFIDDRDFIQIQSMVNVSQYAVLVKSGKRAEALSLILQHEQSMRENGLTFEQLEALQLIWQHYEMDGNKAMADKYALQYYMTKDEFINKSKVGKVDQAKLNLELEQTRDRIQEMSYRQRMQNIVMWGSIIIALLAFALLGMLYMNYRKTKRTNRLLYEKNIALLNEGKELRLTATPAPAAEHADAHDQDGPTQADRNLMDKITAVLESSPEVYGEDFSRQRLAELVDSNVKYVSRAINACKQCNFYMLLNEYRIKEACRRLMDTEGYGSYSLEGIANSVGYKSRSNFAAVFKNIVGLTPSAFQKMHREQGTKHTLRGLTPPRE